LVDGLVQQWKRGDDGEPIDGPVDGIEPVRPLCELIREARLAVGACINAQILGVELQAQKAGGGCRIVGGQKRISATAYGASASLWHPRERHGHGEKCANRPTQLFPDSDCVFHDEPSMFDANGVLRDRAT
jgi:hypothetical protein